MQRGQLNLHSGIGGSLTSVLANMESIWTYLIRNKLDISIKDLKASTLVGKILSNKLT